MDPSVLLPQIVLVLSHLSNRLIGRDTLVGACPLVTGLGRSTEGSIAVLAIRNECLLIETLID